jgi:hypothetical protein
MEQETDERVGQRAHFEWSRKCASRPEPAQNKISVRGERAREEEHGEEATAHESREQNWNAGVSTTERHEQDKTISRLTAPLLAAPFFSSSPFAGNESMCERPAGAHCA